ncbi:hypothetical protein [Alteromonas sp. a30]|uniref:hypothetical protein n=1 Tax=Alteromonas sp. a30 TaxID=2730917 RepID=UPI00227F932A|nr:hypothetical protein [Alteromonas sp. a30]MCY7295051.1 hypothetical protein [Alteromonas sp. a30]
MQNTITFSLVANASLLEMSLFVFMLVLMVFAIYISIRTTKKAQLFLDKSPEAEAKRLMLFRRAKYDEKYKQVMGHHHIDWLEEARRFKETYGK